MKQFTKQFMKQFFIFMILVVVGCGNESTESNSYLGVWIVPAPMSEDIFYRPNLIVDITPDKMTIYEDVFMPIDFTWKADHSIIRYKNDSDVQQLNIEEYEDDKMKVGFENGDSLFFFRLSANDSFVKDKELIDFLESNTLEVIVPKLDWQYRQLLCLPNNQLVKYESKVKDSPYFFVGNWRVLNVHNHYFLFFHNLKDEKPILIHLEEFSEYNLKGKMALNNQLFDVSINVVGSEKAIKSVQEKVVGNWRKPNYVFKADSTFVEITKGDTLSGNWSLNSTGDIIVLQQKKSILQFGFLNDEVSKIDMYYLKNFHNENTMESIEKY